jgi:hypothetical protein
MLRGGRLEQLQKSKSVMNILFERQFDVGKSRDLVDYGKLLVEAQNVNGTEADMEYLEQCLEQQPRTYNSKQLATKLEQERQVSLSGDRIRRILQKRALSGNARDTAIKQNLLPIQTTQTSSVRCTQTRSTIRIHRTDVSG